MKKGRRRAYERALSVRSWASAIALFVALLWIAFMGLAIFKLIPETLFDSAAVLVATLIAFAALYLAVNSMTIAVLQMEQADELHSADKAMSDAIGELAKEFRRRPEISSPVTFALFSSASKLS